MKKYENGQELKKAIEAGFVDVFNFLDGLLICSAGSGKGYYPKDILIVPNPDSNGEFNVYRVTTPDGLTAASLTAIITSDLSMWPMPVSGR